MPDVTAALCVAQRPIAGPGGVIAFLTCLKRDGHKGLHRDSAEGVEWRAIRLQGCGGVMLDLRRDVRHG